MLANPAELERRSISTGRTALPCLGRPDAVPSGGHRRLYPFRAFDALEPFDVLAEDSIDLSVRNVEAVRSPCPDRLRSERGDLAQLLVRAIDHETVLSTNPLSVPARRSRR